MARVSHDDAHPHDHPHGHDHAQAPVPANASVRAARPTDAPAVGIAQSVVWRETYADLLPAEALDQFEPITFSRAWRASLENPPAGARLLVACAGDQVVGYLALGPCTDPDAAPTDVEVLTLGVHPDARRQGHGSRLLNAAVDTSRERGAATVAAWVPLADQRARAFFEGAGLAPDSAYRDRVVGPGGEVLREVRLVGAIA